MSIETTPPPLPTLVLFDVGNVLIQLCPWLGLLPDAVSSGRSEEELAAILSPFLTSDLLRGYERGTIGTPQFFDGVREFFGFRLDNEELRSRFLSILGLPMPGMPELVRELKQRGVRVAGLSDTSDVHLAQLPTYEAVGALEVLLASCEIGMTKPHPETFLYAVERLGVQPQDVFFTDDNEANIAGARAAGLRAEIFRDAEALRTTLGLTR
jgi:HAD superfamily hydrolase (TIGR01509 family)